MTAQTYQLDDYRRQGDTMPKKGYTKLPNWIADTPMSVFERSMLTLIARESLGYQKNVARLSLAELMDRQELSKNTVLKTQKKLTEKGWLFIGKTNGGRCSKTTYSIPSNLINGSRDEQLTEVKTVHEMNTTGSRDEPFKGENGSRDEHARIKKDIKENIKEIPPISPKGEIDPEPLALEPDDSVQDINALKEPQPLQKAWMQDERMKSSFRSILEEYGVTPDARIWKLVAGDFVDYWTNLNPRLAKTKKVAWVDTFRNHIRKQANLHAWRWKKDQQGKPAINAATSSREERSRQIAERAKAMIFGEGGEHESQ